MKTHLIAFSDGSYKKIKPVAWKHSQWIHFTLADGSTVRVNPKNVNYIHDDIQEESLGQEAKAAKDPRAPEERIFTGTTQGLGKIS